MATYKIKQDAAPYYQIVVSFDDQVFEQTVIMTKPTPALFQAYADDYEKRFRENNPAPAPGST